ncbi:S1 RNA-binding domain-containing protein [Streptomyces sp. NPDC057877]|uniref:S1 RNA-binding domain-containing protein n=1 Tax=Streptomyces sp. NPDC057877 TaxID=3346269 RepID=UPI00369E1889
MIDSFSAAVESAEEALRDPGELRFTHLPSLVAFVAELAPADWSVDEAATGVRLTRLLYELGLRGEASRLFTLLQGHLVRKTRRRKTGISRPANALAAVGAALGHVDEARLLLRKVSAADDPWSPVTWANLAVLELERGELATASACVRSARRYLSTADPAQARELRRVLAAVDLRLARASRAGPLGYGVQLLRGRSGGASGTKRYTELAETVARLVRDRGGDSPEAFLAVAHLAVARAEGAVDASDGKELESALTVLEVAAQRLAAMLGADHPKALAVRADLAAVQVEAARAARSPARLERAVGLLRTVVGRLEARLGPAHPRTVAALANLVTAQVESVVAAREPGKAERTAELLAEQAARSGRVLGAGHPVTRLVRASSAACSRMAFGGGQGFDGGSTMLLTLLDTPGEWRTDSGAYRSFTEGMREVDEGARVFQAASDYVLTFHGTVVSVREDGADIEVPHLDDLGFVPRDKLPLGDAPEVGQTVEVNPLGMTDDRGRPLFVASDSQRGRVPDVPKLARSLAMGEALWGIVVRVTPDALVVRVEGRVGRVDLSRPVPGGVPDEGEHVRVKVVRTDSDSRRLDFELVWPYEEPHDSP